MKKVVTIVLVCALALSLAALSGCGGSSDQVTLRVYNWGVNIADGSDDYIDVIELFEEAYPEIDVIYDTYETNEALYTRLAGGGVSYDVIIPSDYMIARMIREDMLLPLNFDNIPNYDLVDDTFKNQSYDPNNEYSVPYTWGTVGIIYNTKYVDEADIGGWDLLWNEKYADRIVMIDNSRDAFAIAEAMLGYSLNTEDPDEIQAAADLLAEQLPILQSYQMDDMYNLMENEEAWIAPYYAGDAMLMMDENPDLAFYLPEDQTFNVFIDAMCIPASAENKEEAELFINFLCEPEISGGNMDYIGYGTPVSAAKEYMDPEMANNPVAYPDEETLARGEAFVALSDEAQQLMDNLFNEVKAGLA
ncbi:MAG TPA: spermidine/putrescine ABC transporter substrate-binding protein [Candidatus Scatomorpha intestinavium]|uniref:Spermidine/putrescine ABC transporter substrate-binding protein n=1 Tax=Candidatus Scatomorpha intestinavium TaxID=2840922 RepID=A0A9D1CRS2_9FIRM|nr:spermidine/putrescine ABC transporter substrate-binding protein [Candidatus Scatomorpha intestinavium]